MNGRALLHLAKHRNVHTCTDPHAFATFNTELAYYIPQLEAQLLDLCILHLDSAQAVLCRHQGARESCKMCCALGWSQQDSAIILQDRFLPSVMPGRLMIHLQPRGTDTSQMTLDE